MNKHADRSLESPWVDIAGDAEPPRRPGPKPVTTLDELKALDEEDLVRGYRAGLTNAADWAERDRGYWHGYLNGLVDGGHARPSAEQAQLARVYVESAAHRAHALGPQGRLAAADARRNQTPT